MRKILLSFSLAVVLGVLLWLAVTWRLFLTTPLTPPQQAVDYVLPPGGTIKTLAHDFQTMGLLPIPNFLILLAHWQGATKNLQAGEYLFPPGTTPSQLLAQLIAGKVIWHRFALIEGWTLQQVLAAINKNPYLTHTLTSTNPALVASKLGLPISNPEGLLLPATYRFSRGKTDVALLQQAYQQMTKILNNAWPLRAANLPYQTPYDALIAASLVEKETAQTNERPIIAGVLIRRLQQNMPLQIDSTLIYGLGSNYRGKLDRTALSEDTLYNTYLHRGLPPTPIAMPSKQALYAVLHPDNSGIMYFVAKGDGTHQFSTTLQAQNKAVTTYQLNMHFPRFDKKNQRLLCQRPWYLSMLLQNLLQNKC